MTQISRSQIWQALNQVKDPEIPVVSLVEMGIVRDVALEVGGGVVVTITPTFSGCPALQVMKADIEARLRQLGVASVKVKQVLAPPWSSDWISDEARRKLKAFGLAPPPKHGGNFEITFFDPVACPYCDSTDTRLRNAWGPTACRMIYTCNTCQQPFEQFKPL